MKKKSQKLSRKFKMPRLFRDDLVEIEDIIKNDLKPSKYTLETKEYEYETVESIPKDTTDTTELTIQTFLPSIYVDLSHSIAEIYTFESQNLITVGALTKISNVIEKRERPILLWFIRVSTPIIFLLFVMLLNLISYKDVLSTTEKSISITITLLCLPYLAIVHYIRFYRYSIVSFVFQNDRQNFIQRNKDQIILVVISAILGGIVTSIITKLF